MGAEIIQAAIGDAAIAQAPDSAAKPEDQGPISTPTRFKVSGIDREAFTVTIGDKTIIHTAELSVLEQIDLSKAMDPRLEGRAGGTFSYVICTIRMINGLAVGFPDTDKQIRAIVIQAGDEAVNYLVVQYGKRLSAALADAKNSRSIPDSD